MTDTPSINGETPSRAGATSPFPIIINSQTLSKEYGGSGCDSCSQLSQAIRQVFNDQTNRISTTHTNQNSCCRKKNKIHLELEGGYKQKVKWYYECSYCDYKSFYTAEIETHITTLHAYLNKSLSDPRLQPINDQEVTVEEELPPDRLSTGLSELDTPKATASQRYKRTSNTVSNAVGKSLSLEKPSGDLPAVAIITSKKQRKSKHKPKIPPEAFQEGVLQTKATAADSMKTASQTSNILMSKSYGTDDVIPVTPPYQIPYTPRNHNNTQYVTSKSAAELIIKPAVSVMSSSPAAVSMMSSSSAAVSMMSSSPVAVSVMSPVPAAVSIMSPSPATVSMSPSSANKYLILVSTERNPTGRLFEIPSAPVTCTTAHVTRAVPITTTASLSSTASPAFIQQPIVYPITSPNVPNVLTLAQTITTNNAKVFRRVIPATLPPDPQQLSRNEAMVLNSVSSNTESVKPHLLPGVSPGSEVKPDSLTSRPDSLTSRPDSLTSRPDSISLQSVSSPLSSTFSPPHKRVDIDQFSNILGLKKVDGSTPPSTPTTQSFTLNCEAVASRILQQLATMATMAQRKSTSRNKPPASAVLLRAIKESIISETGRDQTQSKLPLSIDTLADTVYSRYTSRAIRKSASRNAPPSSGELSYIIKSSYENLLRNKREAELMERDIAKDSNLLTECDIKWLNKYELKYIQTSQRPTENVSEFDRIMERLLSEKWTQKYQPTFSDVRTFRQQALQILSSKAAQNLSEDRLRMVLTNETYGAWFDVVVSKYILLHSLRSKVNKITHSPWAKELSTYRLIAIDTVHSRQNPDSKTKSKTKHGTEIVKTTTNSTMTSTAAPASAAVTTSIAASSSVPPSAVLQKPSATIVSVPPIQITKISSQVQPTVTSATPAPQTESVIPTTASSSSVRTVYDTAIVHTHIITSIPPTSTSTVVTVSSQANKRSTSTIAAAALSAPAYVVSEGKSIAVNRIEQMASSSSALIVTPVSRSDSNPRYSVQVEPAATPVQIKSDITAHVVKELPVESSMDTSYQTITSTESTIVRKDRMTLNLGESKSHLGAVRKFDMTRLQNIPSDLRELQKIITRTITQPRVVVNKSRLLQGVPPDTSIRWQAAVDEASNIPRAGIIRRKQTARKRTTQVTLNRKSDKSSVIKSNFSVTKPVEKVESERPPVSPGLVGSALSLPLPLTVANVEKVSVGSINSKQTLAGTSWHHKPDVMSSAHNEVDMGSNVSSSDSGNAPRVLRKLATRACAAAQQKQQFILTTKRMSPLHITTTEAVRSKPSKPHTVTTRARDEKVTSPYDAAEETEDNPWPSPKESSPTPQMSKPDILLLPPPPAGVKSERVPRLSTGSVETPLLTIGKRSLTPSSRSSSPSIHILSKSSPRISNTATRVSKDTALHALTALCLPEPQSIAAPSPARLTGREVIVPAPCTELTCSSHDHTAAHSADISCMYILHDTRHKPREVKVRRVREDTETEDEDCVWPGPSLSDDDSPADGGDAAPDSEAKSESESEDNEAISHFLHPAWSCLTGCKYHPPYAGMTRIPLLTSTDEPVRSEASGNLKRVRSDSVTSSVGSAKRARLITDTPDSSHKQTVRGGHVITTSSPAPISKDVYEFSSGEENSAPTLPAANIVTAPILTTAGIPTKAGPAIPTLVVRPRRQSPQPTTSSGGQ